MASVNTRLAAARRARGSTRAVGGSMSRAELAEAVAAEVHRVTGREAPIDANYVAKLERGVIRWPSREYRAALRAVLGAASDTELGFHPPRRAEPDLPVVPAPYDDGLLELAARAEATDVSAATLAMLEELTDLLCRAYATSPPELLLAEVRRRVGEVGTLLDARSTLTQRRRLLVVGGWLALLAATLHVDLGDRVHAIGARTAAESLGRETEHGEIVAWSVEVAAWSALIDHDWAGAARLAEQGAGIAPAGSAAAAQLHAQHARAAARLGEAGTVRAQLEAARIAADRQDGARPADHHFSVDTRKIEGYTATSLAWLGDPAGQAVAREVLAGYRAGPPRRLATARVDLGLILARGGHDPEEAAQLGLLAADSGRLVSSNRWRVAELAGALSGQRSLPAVVELHHRVQPGERWW